MAVAKKKTASVFTRVSPELKEQAEAVLDQLQIPMTTALNMFLQQVVNQQKIPFEITNKRAPTDYSTLTKEQFNNEIKKGFADFDDGNTFTPEQVQAELLKHRRG
ncbi:Toxin-antitoxin system, antitoxin component, RelB family (Plasmid stabilization system protein) [Bombilactobacillus mellis]|uniref:Toxin-antitoxin system, antitoxin component, RelB family (Plasmid stabilization system protein) n=1 Tax=Bombilactobacillus mellis TaxID=1218508 RepID=A0A0F4KTH6_9LACO|nr:type II toxin-antitoxin system RelB/DinJ family antitoxin [Bombilactobacillus mellis]KJY48496.1 Toxin-antitoxin system, antitoxin component, RelB family (Plasmid stabilization system protein) [Bombilactobacillus mellis]